MKLSRPSPATAVAFAALILSLIPIARAANTIRSLDIVDGEVKTADLADGSVTRNKIALNAIGSGRIFDESLTLADIAGVNVTGTVSFAGIVAGRCAPALLSVSGAKAGDVPVIATDGTGQAGVFLYATSTPLDGSVKIEICNMSGTTMTPITDLPVRIITFR